MIEDLVWPHLEKLSLEIGPRPNGSPGNLAAAGYIQEIFREAGLEVERQPFPCVAWEAGQTRLTVDGRSLEAVANVFSPPCDLKGKTVAICTVAELENADLGNRVGVLYGDLTKETLSPKGWFLKSERDETIVRLLEEKRPAALITVRASSGQLERLIEDYELDIPSATVPAETGLVLLSQPGARVGLRIQSRRSPGETANIIGRRSAKNTSRGRIVLCAHYDTKIDTPGAYDNGGGVAALLTLAQRWGRRPISQPIEWVAFGGEDHLPLGDDVYVKAAGNNGLGGIVLVVNMDGVGQALGTNTITMLAGDPELEGRVKAAANAFPGVAWVEPWYESNHSTFAMRGIPAVALTSIGGEEPAHLRSDTIDRMSPAKLAEIVDLVSAIINDLAENT